VTTYKGRRTKDEGRRAKRWRVVLYPLAFVLTGAAGCSWDQVNLFARNDPPPKAAGPKDSVVLRPDGLAPAPRSAADSDPDLAAAHEVFRAGDYEKAETLFHRIAEANKTVGSWVSEVISSRPDKGEMNVLVLEEARFYEAECIYLQGRYPKAEDTYLRQLADFGGSGAHKEQAIKRLFDIANYWLEDTREEMRQSAEMRQGKRWVVMPHFLNFATAKPFLDEEGRALEALEAVRYNDINGPYADRALFLLGRVHFFNQNYREADFQFTQLVQMHPTSPFHGQAAEMAMIAKNLSTGGADYDTRKCAEAREMSPVILTSYNEIRAKDPKLADEKEEFLRRQLFGITMQQAEKDYKVAEFYRHTDRPESAYFLYEVVRRRYQGTKFADMATERMHEIRAKVEKENGPKLPVPEAAPLQPDAAQFYQNLPGAPPPAPATPPPGELGQPRPLPPGFGG